MPTVFRITCETCDASGDSPSDVEQRERIEGGFAGAVLTDGRADGSLTQGWYRAVLGADDQLIPSMHPIENSALEEAGYSSWLSASLRGRLVHVRQAICLDCGTLNERSDLTVWPGALGCLLVLAVMIIGAFLVNVHGVWALVLSGTLVGFFVLDLAMLCVVRLAFRTRRSRLRSLECRNCGSRHAVSVERAVGKKLPCPRCKTPTQTVSLAGRS